MMNYDESLLMNIEQQLLLFNIMSNFFVTLFAEISGYSAFI
jgi:hypothetical protein